MMDALVTFDGVGKSFDGKRVLDRFSHAFSRNTLTFIKGPSGAGKTTLLRLACGLEEPDEGAVVRAPGLRFSVVFQENRLCENLSAAANVRLVCADAHGDAPGVLLARLGLADRAGVAVRLLSGGEKRRVALARALAAPADVLLMDEPCTGLDETTKEQVIAVMAGYLADKAVLWVTHDMDEAASFNGYDVVSIGSQAEG